MKKVILFIHFYFLVSLVNVHSGRTDSDGGHYRHSDGSYHYHNGGSGRGGGLGDWTGTESIGAWLGLLLVLYFSGSLKSTIKIQKRIRTISHKALNPKVIIKLMKK